MSRSDWLPAIISHRGLCDGSPFVENSRPAFEAATRAGFATECDVWPSVEGEPVVIHDPTLDRTSFGVGPVSRYSVNEVRQIRLRDAPEALTTVSTLREVATVVNFVEIKPADNRSVVYEVMQIMAGRDWRLMSFDPANLVHAERLDPSLPLAFLIEHPEGVDAAIAGRWPAYFDQSVLDESIARRLRAAGVQIGVWGVNSEADYRRIAPARPDAILSDTPRLIRSLHAN